MTLQAKINELNQAYAVAFVAEGSNAMTLEIEERLQSARDDLAIAIDDECIASYAAGRNHESRKREKY